MAIRNRLTRRTLLVGATTALVIGVTAGTALAVNATWTVKPGGAFSFSGSAQVKDATNPAHTVAKCTSVKLSGTLKTGSGNSGTGIGTITSASFSGCTIANISVTVTTHGLPWHENALSFNKTAGVTTGTISGIDLVATTTGCTATLDGTAAGANNGVTKMTYTNSTGKIKLLGTGGNLHSYAVVGCFGLVNNNDVQQASGSGTVTPKQTITSP
jgi:hypothetical protein